jgi:hypothetical protein
VSYALNRGLQPAVEEKSASHTIYAYSTKGLLHKFNEKPSYKAPTTERYEHPRVVWSNARQGDATDGASDSQGKSAPSFFSYDRVAISTGIHVKRERLLTPFSCQDHNKRRNLMAHWDIPTGTHSKSSGNLFVWNTTDNNLTTSQFKVQVGTYAGGYNVYKKLSTSPLKVF